MASIPTEVKRYVLLLEANRCTACNFHFSKDCGRAMTFIRLRVDMAVSDPKNIYICCSVCAPIVESYRRRLASTWAR